MGKRALLILVAVLLLTSSATAWSKYDDVGYGLCMVVTRNRDSQVCIRTGPSKDCWVCNYASYGDKYICLQVIDGWA